MKPAKTKSSTLERDLNYFVGAAFVFNALLLISSVLLDYYGYTRILSQQKTRKELFPYDYAIQWYIGPVQDSTSRYLTNTILSYFAMYSYVIPISLFVTMEVVRLAQGAFMVWDNKLKTIYTALDDTTSVIPMRANNTNLNEELARIDYVFSDKTGTFTKNEMKLAKWFIGDVVYDELGDPGSLGRELDKNVS